MEKLNSKNLLKHILPILLIGLILPMFILGNNIKIKSFRHFVLSPILVISQKDNSGFVLRTNYKNNLINNNLQLYKKINKTVKYFVLEIKAQNN